MDDNKKVAVSHSGSLICSTARDQHATLSAEEWANQWCEHLDKCAACRWHNKCDEGKAIYFQDTLPEE